MNNLLTKVTTVLDNLILNPGEFAESCAIEEVRQVGSFKKGTMRTGKNIADVVVILKTIPTKESIEALSKKVEDLLKESMKSEVIPKNEMITVQITEKGFDVFNWQARICILIATLPPNIRKVENAEMQKNLINNLSAVRHIRFFEENSNASVKVLIRILRDVFGRFEALSVMNPWMVDLLSNFAILSNSSRQALTLSQAFRRVFQLLSAGFFLPGSSGLLDPCENVPVRIHTCLSLEQQDNLCMTAQTLLRILCHGGFKVLLGTEKKENLISEMSVFDGIVISPLKLAYEPQNDVIANENENENDDDMETDTPEENMEQT